MSYFIIIYYLLLIYLLLITEHPFIKKLYSYKLNSVAYITSVQYIEYENKLKVFIYSKEKDIKIFNCIVYYEMYKEICIPILVYRTRIILNLMEIKTINNKIPKYLKINNISISIPRSYRSNNYKFVSCYTVMTYYDRPLALIELIESNKYFGASKIVIYYHSSSNTVLNILKYYSKLGIVDVYQYQNDSKFKDIESKRDRLTYHFCIFKINHCFNEYKTSRNRMVFLDLDEILWTANENSYEEMILALPNKKSFLLNEHFYKFEYSIPDNIERNESTILPDIDIFSIKTICPIRSGYNHKYIIINSTQFLGAENHFPYSKIKEKYDFVDNNIAFIRHTRRFNEGALRQCPISKLLNNSVTKVEKNIYKKSLKIYRLLKNIYY